MDNGHGNLGQESIHSIAETLRDIYRTLNEPCSEVDYHLAVCALEEVLRLLEEISEA